MFSVLYLEINFVGIAILLLLLLNMRLYTSKELPIDQKIFRFLMVVTILIFIFDSGMWLAEGRATQIFMAVNYCSTLCYYILNPLICFVWLVYTDFKVFESRSGLCCRMRFYVIPVLFSSVISVMSVATGWFFQINDQGTYSRGPLFWLMALIALLYLAASFVVSVWDALRNGWEDNKNVHIHLVLFPVGICIASIVQIRFFGLSIIWICCMLACVSIYINIQNGEISTDHLTGLFNRRRLDEHLNRRIKNDRKQRLLFAVVFDLDDFKHLNDTYGHHAGDKVLVHFSGILRDCCGAGDDFIARMGGDEFLVIGERTDRHETERLLVRLQELVEMHNESHDRQNQIAFSKGVAFYKDGDTADSFLAAADNAMYQEKQEHKSNMAKISARI